MIFKPEQFSTSSLRSSPLGTKICQVLAATLNQADAGMCLRSHLQVESDNLLIDTSRTELAIFNNVYLVGVGKAALPMTSTMIDLIGKRITSGVVLTKNGYTGCMDLVDDRIEIFEAGHPIPDQRNIKASTKLLTKMSHLNTDDLVICLISGGGSALLTKPAHGITLADLQQTNNVLLRCGASIDDINTVRKHLDELKGGGLARVLYPAQIITLILSDVPGDRLHSIASGPTVPDPTTFADAYKVLTKFGILDQVPDCVLNHLNEGLSREIPETLKPGSYYFEHTTNHLVGSNSQLVTAAAQVANSTGFTTELLPVMLHGEASLAGQELVDYAKSFGKHTKLTQPLCLIAGGETTVTVNGLGKGGRNQELVLGAVKSLASAENLILISQATDGGDGPTDAAGAVATQQTYQRGLHKALDPQYYLTRNDSYSYFDSLDDLIKIGPTLTNLNDLVFVFSS
ncbi:MAG: glycerate kinase [Anaerolineae bacterium]|nr:glycerate kinase [Anaerolineae bacterium]